MGPIFIPESGKVTDSDLKG